MRSHICLVVMNIAGLKVCDFAIADKNATALRAARARSSSSSGAMEAGNVWEGSNANTHILR